MIHGPHREGFSHLRRHALRELAAVGLVGHHLHGELQPRHHPDECRHEHQLPREDQLAAEHRPAGRPVRVSGQFVGRGPLEERLLRTVSSPKRR